MKTKPLSALRLLAAPGDFQLQLTSGKVSVEGLTATCDRDLQTTCEQFLGANFRVADFELDVKQHFTPAQVDAFLSQHNIPMDDDDNAVGANEIVFVANHGHERVPGSADDYYMMKRVGGDSIFRKVYPDEIFGTAWVHDYPKSFGGTGPVLCIEKNVTSDKPKPPDGCQGEQEETEAPTEIDTSNGGGASGDPHIIDWAGNKYDFHGGCDLVLAHVPGVLDMDIHIRTRIHTWWSSVGSLALRIGQDTLEIESGTLEKQEDNPYWWNGEPGQQSKSGKLRAKLGGYTVRYHFFTLFARQFRVNLGDGDEITIRVYKDFVSVRVKVETPEKFGSALGLMGSYPTGNRLGRDGVTTVEDIDAFGKEWQVLATEPKLFHNLEGPQPPNACAMPDTSQPALARRRRLGEQSLSRQDAENACAPIHHIQDRESCIEDVLVTDDKGMVVSYLM